jgi:hypothetical protein
MLVAIRGVATARARDFEGVDEGLGIIGLGFILLSLVLPPIGGAIDAHLDGIRPVYQRMKKWRASLIAIRRFERALGKVVTDVESTLNGVRTHCLHHASRIYPGVCDFAVAKDRLDIKRGQTVENREQTVAASLPTFAEACWRPVAPRFDQVVADTKGYRDTCEEIATRSIRTSEPLSRSFELHPEPEEAAS